MYQHWKPNFASQKNETVSKLMRQILHDKTFSDYLFVENNKVSNILKNAFECNKSVQLLVSPDGSGKTTQLIRHANWAVKRGEHVKYIPKVFFKRHFFDAFHYNKETDFKMWVESILPRKSFVIIDTESPYLTSDMEDIVCCFADQSYSKDNVKLIVSTSSTQLAKQINSLFEKNTLEQIGRAQNWKLTHEMVDEYFQSFDVGCIEDTVKKVAYKAASPNFMYLLNYYYYPNRELALHFGNTKYESLIAEKSEAYYRQWQMFEELGF